MLLTEHPAFEVTVVPADGRWKMVVEGELDLRSGRDVREVAEFLAIAPVAAVEFDLTGVTFMDTAGWRSVQDARRLLAGRATSVTVGPVSAAVRRFLSAVAPCATSR
jgi:anti-anti-sigma regulatory factor